MIKRPLALAVISFISGVIAVMFEINLLFVCIGAVFVCMAAFVIYGKKASLVCLIIAAFLLCGVLRANVANDHRRKTAALYDSRVLTTNLTITDFSEGNSAIAQFKDEEKTIKVYLSVKKQKELFPGDVISGEFTLRKPFSSKISVSDFSTYLCSRNIYLYAYAEDVKLVGSCDERIKGFIYAVRRYINDIGFVNFDGNHRAFFNAMVLGDKRLISDELMHSLQGSGLNHIAVVSGMHLSIMITTLMLLLNKIFGRRRIGGVIFIVGALFITLATGAGASVIRACIMCSIYQLARMCYRENDGITSLCMASGAMCAYNPYIIFNAGFVLSVLSVLGLILYSEKLTFLFKPFLPKKMDEAAALCVAAQLTLTPAVLYYFNIFTPYALLSNILVFPFATAIVIVGMAFAVFANVPVISDVIGFLVKLLSDVIEYICSAVSAIPGAILNMDSPDAVFLIIWVFALTAIYMYPKKKALIAPLAAVTLIMIVVSSISHFAKKDDIHFLSLNYGTSSTTAMQLPTGGLFLIDCADMWDSMDIATHYKKSYFDYAVLTSKSEKEVPQLAKSGYIKSLVLPDELYDEKEKEAIIKQSHEYNMRTDFLKNGESIFADGAFIEYLPLEQTGNEKRCVKIEYKGKSFVTLQGFEGKDIEKLCSLNMKIPCDVLKLPFAILGEETDIKTLTDGQIVQTEKEFNIN